MDDQEEINDVQLDYDLESVAESMNFLKDYMFKYGAVSAFGVTIPDYDGQSRCFLRQD